MLIISEICYYICMDMLMILLAKYLYIVIIVVFIVYALFQSRETQKKLFILTIIALPIIYIFAKIAGHFFFDPRPFVTMHIKPLIPHAADNGFPSDHTLISAAFASVLFVFSKKWGVGAFILALLVGISRIYVHVHSPIDILGSIVISIVATALIILGLRRFFRLGI